MNQSILADYLEFLNNQIDSHEKLLEYHQEADAMVQVFLASNLDSKTGITIYHYVSIIGGIIHRAKTLNGELLDLFLKLRAAILKGPPRGGSGIVNLH